MDGQPRANRDPLCSMGRQVLKSAFRDRFSAHSDRLFEQKYGRTIVIGILKEFRRHTARPRSLAAASKGRGDARRSAEGYAVRELKQNIIMIRKQLRIGICDNPGRPVVLFDPPPYFSQHIVQAITETTYEPMVKLVCSHSRGPHRSSETDSEASFPIAKTPFTVQPRSARAAQDVPRARGHGRCLPAVFVR
jgi:hypothetical protein